MLFHLSLLHLRVNLLIGKCLSMTIPEWIFHFIAGVQNDHYILQSNFSFRSGLSCQLLDLFLVRPGANIQIWFMSYCKLLPIIGRLASQKPTFFNFGNSAGSANRNTDALCFQTKLPATFPSDTLYSLWLLWSVFNYYSRWNIDINLLDAGSIWRYFTGLFHWLYTFSSVYLNSFSDTVI